MRVGLDARTMITPRPRGTGRNLLDAYRIIPALRPEWEFVLYHQRPLPTENAPPDPPWNFPNVRLRQIDMPGDRVDAWFQVRLPLAAREDRLDLLHCPANAAPRFNPVPLVATIHDLAPLRVPGELPQYATSVFRRGVQRALRSASRIITPSEATRRDLMDEFNIEGDGLCVVPWAADSQFIAAARGPKDATTRDTVLKSYGLEKPYFVTFAGDVPRKNAAGVVHALAELRADLAGVEVLFVGCDAAETRAALFDEAHRLGVIESCRLHRFIPLNDLTTLMAASRGLLIPSLCEGFGLPVLDAFACGIPVLASNTGSLPEVAGDAAVYCDPNHPASIARGMAALLDPDSAARLVARGEVRLTEFTWEQTATRMCEVYEQTAAPLAAVAAGRADA